MKVDLMTNVGKTEEELLKETQKYSTAQDFVKGQLRRKIIAYHGTYKGGFSKFKKGAAQNTNILSDTDLGGLIGFSFSAEPEAAFQFSRNLKKWGLKKDKTDGYQKFSSLMKVELTIKNPLVFGKPDFREKKDTSDGYSEFTKWKEDFLDGKTFMKDWLKDWIKETGHDCILVHSCIDGGTQYLVFSPSKIRCLDEKWVMDQTGKMNTRLPEEYKEEAKELKKVLGDIWKRAKEQEQGFELS